MRKPVLILTALLTLAAPALPALPAAAKAPAAASTPAIAWAPCAEDPAVECGTVTVPVDWDNPGSGTFELAVARRKATDPAARIGSLVINPGGPGGSGVDGVLEQWFPFGPEVTSRFDVVGFDPRGVKRSHPILCSAELAAQTPDPFTTDRAGFERRLAFNERYRQDCRARTGPLFDHVDTGSVVRDLDALRAALGDRKLTFYGTSYGTLIGQQYADRYPHRVRALALDSTVDHTLDTAGWVGTGAWGAEDAFDEFVAWCDTSTDCVLHGTDVRALWAGLMAKAERGELRFPGVPDVVVTKALLMFQAFGGFYAPDWAGTAAVLRWIAGGTPPPAGTPLLTPTTKAPEAKAADEVVNDATQVLCQDFALPVRDHREYARLLRASARIAPDMAGSPLSLTVLAACLGQPAPVPNPQRRAHADGSPTLLLANTLHDPATVYPWALSLSRQIGREARLLTHEGWGHGVYGRGECATAIFDRYLVSLVPPRRGAHCPAVPPAQARALRTPPPFRGPLPGLPGFTLVTR
ncbi:alpha/beta fold hydrolase [Nonomuraea sp. NN258]|uniref:alpha/beta fold hydrolase n=1 Tax=Nonomuraea antri TaxID=2730852 RepID=UPI001568E8D8|nr:alpha/beta fold hydrolase [Nonomuraea antri]NRQ32007.1 alpha/beta fold hydrolase [Nonomuraea antri]